LFESVAMIVDQHQPVVEKYYGKGKMASVINCLLDECNRVVKNLVEGWEEERSMKRKVSVWDSSFIYDPKRLALKLADVSSHSTFHQNISPITRKQPSQLAVSDDDVDPREIDKALTEVAGMAGRWSLFRKFLTDNLKVRMFRPV
jgi:hypothetical protein